MIDKTLLYLSIAVCTVSVIVCGVVIWSTNKTVSTIYKIVDELKDTPEELSEANKQNVKNEVIAVKVERKRFRLFRRKEKFNQSLNN